MRAETTLNKLADLLGLDKSLVEKAAPVASDPKVKRRVAKRAEEQNKLNRKFDGVAEDRIQEFRQAQGIVYFLQAPALFSHKICKHCGESFFVSRQQVAFCSYTCIKNSLAALGINWQKGDDLEALVNDPQVFDGNEPIWIKNIDQLKEALRILCEFSSTPSS
jgi:hypothetical protein